MKCAGIATDTRESSLLNDLLRALPYIARAMNDPGLWLGFRVHDPRADTSYLRVVSKDELVALAPPRRRFLVGLHAFDAGRELGTLHDHRFPIAVLPLAADERVDELLYTMPWEEHDERDRVLRGTMRVFEGSAYAIECCARIRHAIHSSRKHLSINVTDVSQPATRENRLVAESVGAAAISEVCSRVRAALCRASPTLAH